MNQGLRFKAAREFLRYSQAQVADLIGISQNSISKIESNKTEKPNFRYTIFLKENGISQDWLLEEKGNMVEDSKTIKTNNKSDKSYKDKSYNSAEDWKLKYEEAELRAEKSEKEVSILKETISELRKELNDLYKKIVNNNIHLEVDLGKDKACLIGSFENEEVAKSVSLYSELDTPVLAVV